METRLAIAVGLLLLLLLLDPELRLGCESCWLGHQSILELALALAHEAGLLGHLGLEVLTWWTD